MMWSDQVLIWVTNFGDPWIVVPLVLGAGGAFALRKQYRQAVLLIAGVAGATAAGALLKQVFRRERPPLDERLVEVSSYSFPSSHAVTSCALALAIVLLAWRTRWRWFVVIVAAVYVLVIGFSRVHLNVHYVSDVVAGWVFSGLWVYLIYRLLRYDAGHGK